MLITTTIPIALPEDWVGSIGNVSGQVISDLFPIILLVVGIVLGFYLLSKVRSLFAIRAK